MTSRAAEGGAPSDDRRHVGDGGWSLSAESFRDFVRCSADGIVVIDDQGRVVEWNAAEERMTGVSREMAVGAELWQVQAWLIPERERTPERITAARERIRRGLSEGLRLQRTLEEEIERPDGERRVVQSRLFAIELGKRLFACGVCRDVTDRRRAEREVEEEVAILRAAAARVAEQQQRSSEERRDLALAAARAEERERRRIAGLLHDDLQQRLAATRYHLGLLRRALEYDRGLGGIVDVIDGALEETMLSARDLSHDLMPAAGRETDLGALVARLAEHVRSTLGLEVAIDSAPAVPIRSSAVALFLARAVQELLFNVAKHSRSRRAGVRVRVFGHYLGVSVTDAGPWSAPLSGHRMGIGLGQIQQRVEALGGRLSVRVRATGAGTVRIVVPDKE